MKDAVGGTLSVGTGFSKGYIGKGLPGAAAVILCLCLTWAPRTHAVEYPAVPSVDGVAVYRDVRDRVGEALQDRMAEVDKALADAILQVRESDDGTERESLEEMIRSLTGLRRILSRIPDDFAKATR